MEETVSPAHLSDSDPPRPQPVDSPPPQPRAPSRWVPAGIVAGALSVVAVGWILIERAEAAVNTVALAAAPKPVAAIVARETTFRETHKYVGTLRPWVEANVGPQFVSAYVNTVLVRPGASVKANEVLATLDCRYASASSLAVAAEARAIDARQKAIADESARLNSLLDGGFVSPNEAEQKQAQSTSEQAQLAAERAKLTSSGLAVNDCVLRAPFDGEISVRTIDPGAFVRPGTSIVTIVDRNTVRMTFDVPEGDFDAVAPAAPVSIRVLATDKTIAAAVARRSPAADPDTRTVHVEADLENSSHVLPVNTTGEVTIQVGPAKPAVTVPLVAASITGSHAAVFVIDGDIVHKRTFEIQGEQGSDLYLDTNLKPGSLVVTEGRELLAEGDRVSVTEMKSGRATFTGRPTPQNGRFPEVTP